MSVFNIKNEKECEKMKEPIFLSPAFKDYIWGGTRLKKELKKDTPYSITAESWEVSTNEHGISKIKNGEYQDNDLDTLFKMQEKRSEIFGTKTKTMEEFPLLIKFIDASTNLSVQVHPDDQYAFEKENKRKGKTEMWYIMDCLEGAQIICGMKEGVKQEELASILKSNQVADYLNYVTVKKGDCIYIPSGTIHAILGNTLICEIQQNSDLTYRVYDWGRVGADGKPRQLHQDKAIDVIHLESKPQIMNTNHIVSGEKTIVSCPYFQTDKVVVNQEFKDQSDPNTFFAYNIVEGNGRIIVKDREYSIQLGDSFLIPASLGSYTLQGKMKLLKSYL